MLNLNLTKVVGLASATLMCAFLTSAPTQAQQNPRTTQRENTRRMGNPPQVDETFVRNAAEGGMAEVKLGQLAEEKAQNPEVKKFAQRMVEDHSKANDELKQVASREHINLPTNVSSKDAQTYRSLEKLSGPQFDKAYAQQMVRDHEKDVSEFKQATTSAQNPAVRQFAQQTLPTLESHLQEARQMEQSVSRNAIGKGKSY